MSKTQDWEAYFDLWQRVECLPEPVPELRFCETRRWRFDRAFPAYHVAIEVDGGAFSSGRHTRGAGFVKDLEKLNAAVERGWFVLRYTPDQIKTGAFVTTLRNTLQRNGWQYV